jgi:hypothetical protein
MSDGRKTTLKVNPPSPSAKSMTRTNAPLSPSAMMSMTSTNAPPSPSRLQDPGFYSNRDSTLAAPPGNVSLLIAQLLQLQKQLAATQKELAAIKEFTPLSIEYAKWEKNLDELEEKLLQAKKDYVADVVRKRMAHKILVKLVKSLREKYPSADFDEKYKIVKEQYKARFITLKAKMNEVMEESKGLDSIAMARVIHEHKTALAVLYEKNISFVQDYTQYAAEANTLLLQHLLTRTRLKFGVISLRNKINAIEHSITKQLEKFNQLTAGWERGQSANFHVWLSSQKSSAPAAKVLTRVDTILNSQSAFFQQYHPGQWHGDLNENLQKAVHSSTFDEVRMLCRKGANPESFDDSGRNCLMLALRQRESEAPASDTQIKIVNYLLTVQRVNPRCDCAYKTSIASSIVNTRITYNIPANSPTVLFAILSSWEFSVKTRSIYEILLKDIDLERKDVYGYTLLTWAALCNNLSMVMELKSRGANCETALAALAKDKKEITLEIREALAVKPMPTIAPK